MEEQEREYMIVMKVSGSLPPLSFIVYKSRGRTDTPVGVGTKERQLERHLSSSIITLLCSLHTTFFFSLFSVLATFFFLAFSSPLYLFFYPCRTVYLHFSLSLKQFPSHLFSPPPPPSPPPSLRLADSVLPWCLDHVGHGRLLNIHHFRMSHKTNRPPSWTESTITVCNAKAHTLALAEEREVKKAGEEHRKRWAADLYAFIRAWP